MNQPPEQEPNWVVRGGMATPSQLQAGTAQHRGVPEPPGLYGFSVQYQPGKTIEELTVTDAALVAAGGSAGYPVHIVNSPGVGYHHTVQVPFPFPLVLARALSAVFTQMPNPARLLDS
jgi:hypothetical protein